MTEETAPKPRRLRFTRVLMIMINGVMKPVDCTLDCVIYGAYDEKKAVLSTARTEEGGLYLTLDPDPPTEPEPVALVHTIIPTRDHPTHTAVEEDELPPEFRPDHRAPPRSALLNGTSITS